MTKKEKRIILDRFLSRCLSSFDGEEIDMYQVGRYEGVVIFARRLNLISLDEYLYLMDVLNIVFG